MTKAKSKAARRRGKPRPPVTDLDHRKTDRSEPADRVALEARARINNLTLDEAKNPMSATAIGRLTIRRVLDQVQHDALYRMVLLCGEYQQAMLSPNLPRQPKEGFTASDQASYEAWCLSVRSAYRSAIKAIHDKEKATGNRQIWDAFSRIALSEMEVPHLVPELVICADALKKHFGMESGQISRKAA